MSDAVLSGRAALVTGASSGLGRHFALTLAHAGADYALRTPALMTISALLAGILVVQGMRDMAAGERYLVSSSS